MFSFSQARFWVVLLVSLSLAMFVFDAPNLELSFERAEERDDGNDNNNEGEDDDGHVSRPDANAFFSLSVLQNAKRSDVKLDPFPHVVMKNALPDDLYERLASAYPTHQQVFQVAKGHRKNIPANVRSGFASGYDFRRR